MSRLLLILLAISSVHSTIKKYPDTFIMSRNGTKTIIDPAEPIIAGGIEFYWTGFHQPSLNLPLICEVSYSSQHWHFGVVHFANGSEPRGVQYGCPRSSACGTFECIERGEDGNLTVLIMLGCICFFLGYQANSLFDSRADTFRFIRQIGAVTTIVPSKLPMPNDIHNDYLRVM